jgi:hypothetical protein
MMAEGARAPTFRGGARNRPHKTFDFFQKKCFFYVNKKKCMRGAPATATSIKIEGKYSERYVRTVGGLKQMNPSLVIR